MSVAFLKPRSQALKFYIFASCCAERERSAHKDAPRGPKGLAPWLIFFRHFFVQRQRNGTKPYTERAQLDEVEVGCARL